MRFLSLLFVVAIALIGAGFASLNGAPVALNLYFFNTELALSTALLLSVVVGASLGAMAMLLPWLRARRSARSMRRQLALLEEELNNLRTIPLKD